MKRERIQIIHNILECVQERNGSIRPTHVLYKANLSHQMLDEYLNELIIKGFITENNLKNGKTYSLTQKGFDFLKKYELIINFLDSFGLG